MVPLWKKATSPTIEDTAREIVIKRALTKQLSRYVRDLQQELVGISADGVVTGGENASNVCFCLEAIFLHGLKDTFAKKMSSMFGTAGQDRIPTPDFWAFVMVYTHRDVLAQITRLNQVTTDVGRCRAWIRLALNENLLVSYVEAMMRDPKSVRCYYRPTAYMADREQPDILKQFLDGLTGFSFRLPVNCSVLNHWNPTPLQLAGIRQTPLEPVMPGIDVADFFQYDTRRSRSKLSVSTARGVTASVAIQADVLPPESSLSVKNEAGSRLDIHHESHIQQELTNEPEEKLRAGYREPVVAEDRLSGEASGSLSSISSAQVHELIQNLNMDANEGSKVHEGSPVSEPDFDVVENFPHETSKLPGNVLDPGVGWSSPFDDDDSAEGELEVEEPQSYDSLVLSYTQNVNRSLSGTPETRDFVSSTVRGSNEKMMPKEDTSEVSTSENSSEDLDFEMVPAAGTVDEETTELLQYLGKIQQEKGLDQQSYMCRSCHCPVGMIYGTASVCSYDGCSYCADCIGNEENVIPARIVHNWDFRRYPVSCRAKDFLKKVEHDPLLDLRSLNPSLYSAVPELAAVQVLRLQLSFLRPYLHTCSDTASSELRRLVWPREHLYEHVHLYSTFDMLQVPSGALNRTLQRAIAFARKHISSCQLCAAKGFVCEICRDPAVIYAFDMDVTHHCTVCFAVYHSVCFETTRSCPRCERRRQREDQSSVAGGEMLFGY